MCNKKNANAATEAVVRIYANEFITLCERQATGKLEINGLFILLIGSYNRKEETNKFQPTYYSIFRCRIKKTLLESIDYNCFILINNWYVKFKVKCT